MIISVFRKLQTDLSKKENCKPKLPKERNRNLTLVVFGCKNQNSKKKFRHLHEDLNLDEIKNALRLLSVNGETNLMNLIRL